MTILIDIKGGMSLDGKFPALRVGEEYYGRVTASGGTPFYTYKIVKGTLPAGLTLDTITGEVTGTPTKDQMSAVTVRATDLQGMWVERAFAIPGTTDIMPLGGLVGYWPCNETSGAVLHDASGNGYDGVIVSDLSVTVGAPPLRPGSGASLGTTSRLNQAAYVTLPTGVMPTNKHWTLEAIGVSDGHGADFWDTLVCTREGGGIEPGDPGIYGGTYGSAWAARTVYGNSHTIATTVTNTVPAHFMLVRDGDLSFLYVNGVQFAPAVQPTGMNVPDGTVRLLGSGNYPGSYGMVGRVSDVALYSQSASAAQAALRASHYGFA